MSRGKRLEEPAPRASIADLIGIDAAVALSCAFGGCRLYVPRRPGAYHPITVAIGADAAARLGEAYAGTPIDVPLAAGRQQEARQLAEQGLTRRSIARQTRYTERHIYRLLAAEDESRDAPDLFAPRSTT